jgi:hypothetical protein
MALSLQQKLVLAGTLSKVQPQLQRLHLVEKPKPRRRVRIAVLVGGMMAVGAVVAVVLFRRQGCGDGAVAATLRQAPR